MINNVAKLVARMAHGYQTYSNRPYMWHLSMVVDILTHYNYPPWAIAAGWLHDTLEDTNLTYNDLLEAFGEQVADAVEACTGRGVNRKMRQADILHKLEFGPFGRTEARCVKLADRMANLHVCFTEPTNPLIAMYLKEDPAFRQAINATYVKSEQWDDYTRMVAEKKPLPWLEVA